MKIMEYMKKNRMLKGYGKQRKKPEISTMSFVLNIEEKAYIITTIRINTINNNITVQSNPMSSYYHRYGRYKKMKRGRYKINQNNIAFQG